MRSTPLSFHYVNPLQEKFGADFFKAIPQVSGVYFMHHSDDSILYIGKAKDLRARLASYKLAKPGTAADHTLEMLESVARIRWEEHPTEEQAILRESELLHAVRPPFNIAGAWPQKYLYLGLKKVPGKAPDRSSVHFQLTSRREIATDMRLYGCFKHRRRTKMGYTALLRLLHAASSSPEKRRFGFPARITRNAPPYLYSMEVPSSLLEPLERFLAGKSSNLLRLLCEQMLANENIPRFMRPSLQDDIEVVKDFFRLGPRATHLLKRQHGIRFRVLSHRLMDEILRQSCHERNLIQAERKAG